MTNEKDESEEINYDKFGDTDWQSTFRLATPEDEQTEDSKPKQQPKTKQND